MTRLKFTIYQLLIIIFAFVSINAYANMIVSNVELGKTMLKDVPNLTAHLGHGHGFKASDMNKDRGRALKEHGITFIGLPKLVNAYMVRLPNGKQKYAALFDYIEVLNQLFAESIKENAQNTYHEILAYYTEYGLAAGGIKTSYFVHNKNRKFGILLTMFNFDGTKENSKLINVVELFDSKKYSFEELRSVLKSKYKYIKNTNNSSMISEEVLAMLDGLVFKANDGDFITLVKLSDEYSLVSYEEKENYNNHTKFLDKLMAKFTEDKSDKRTALKEII